MRIILTLVAVVAAATLGPSAAVADAAEGPSVDGGGAPVGSACGSAEPARFEPGLTWQAGRDTAAGYAPPDNFKLIYACPGGPRGERIPELTLTAPW